MSSSLLPGRRSVRELLTHAKDAAELMVDLAYASVFFGDHALGREVRRLEQVLDDDLADLYERCMLAAHVPPRTPPASPACSNSPRRSRRSPTPPRTSPRSHCAASAYPVSSATTSGTPPRSWLASRSATTPT